MQLIVSRKPCLLLEAAELVFAQFIFPPKRLSFPVSIAFRQRKSSGSNHKFVRCFP